MLQTAAVEAMAVILEVAVEMEVTEEIVVLVMEETAGMVVMAVLVEGMVEMVEIVDEEAVI
jgi:hypothetical protein